jgi:hypothetical protein
VTPAIALARAQYVAAATDKNPDTGHAIEPASDFSFHTVAFADLMSNLCHRME